MNWQQSKSNYRFNANEIEMIFLKYFIGNTLHLQNQKKIAELEDRLAVMIKKHNEKMTVSV